MWKERVVSIQKVKSKIEHFKGKQPSSKWTLITENGVCKVFKRNAFIMFSPTGVVL
jgi:hypothetical protein